MKITYIALTLYALCYALLFGTWTAIVFNKVPGADQIVTYIQIGLGTLSGHVLTMLNPGRAGGSAAPTNQAGFASPFLLIVIAAVVATLSGCASFQQAVDAYGTTAITSAKHANDSLIVAWSTAACATPISAALRNPQIIPALRVLCMPGAEANPSSLLDSVSLVKGVSPAGATP